MPEKSKRSWLLLVLALAVNSAVAAWSAGDSPPPPLLAASPVTALSPATTSLQPSTTAFVTSTTVSTVSPPEVPSTTIVLPATTRTVLVSSAAPTTTTTGLDAPTTTLGADLRPTPSTAEPDIVTLPPTSTTLESQTGYVTVPASPPASGPPVISRLRHSPNRGDTGTIITITAAAFTSDQDAADISIFVWLTDGPRTLAKECSHTVPCSYSAMFTAGIWHYEVTATDGTGSQATSAGSADSTFEVVAAHL